MMPTAWRNCVVWEEERRGHEQTSEKAPVELVAVPQLVISILDERASRPLRLDWFVATLVPDIYPPVPQERISLRWERRVRLSHFPTDQAGKVD